MIQPRDCCGLTANACESGIRAPSRETHALPGQVIAGNARERHPNGTHPTAIVVGTESRGTPADVIADRASDRRRGHQRQEGTHADGMPGTALGRHHVRQVSAALRRGAAQPAHAARRRTRPEIVPILTVGITGNAIPIYPAARLMRSALGRN